jgi:hypothetical protein
MRARRKSDARRLGKSKLRHHECELMPGEHRMGGYGQRLESVLFPIATVTN